MSDIVTRLLLKTNDFDANLNKSKKNVNGFQSDIAKMSGVAVSGVMKFAGVLGIAVTASEGFNKVMNSSQTLGDEYARTMDGLKGGVDQFFYSIGSGDWTPFMNGLSETIRLAREAYNAMDQLGNTKMSFSYFDAKNQAIVQEQITILKDKDSTEEQKKAARELLDKTLKDQEEIVGQYKRRSNNAVRAMVKAAIGLDGVDVSGIDIDKVLKLDVSSAGDEQKAQLAKQYKDFVDEYDRLKAKFTTYETVGSGMNVHTVATTDAKALGEAISPMLAKYQDAIQYNAILVKKSDEWLQNLINVSAAAEAAGRNLSSMTKAANRASQSGTGGNPPFKIAHGEMKDGALPIPIKPTYDKVPTHGNTGKDFKLPKHDPLFKKEDIDLNQEYAESLANISGVVGSMSGLFDDNTASVLQWGVSFLSTVGQAIPKILEMASANEVEAATARKSAIANMSAAGGEVLKAHAGIPFVGIALGLAGVAAIIAAMSSMPKYATGGIVPGTSFTGDKVPALLNSGEMILNGSQQSNLFRMLNSGLYGSLSQKIAPSGNDDIRLYSDVEIKGDRIFLALHNHIKKTGKRLW